jgi:hypothetical protein
MDLCVIGGLSLPPPGPLAGLLGRSGLQLQKEPIPTLELSVKITPKVPSAPQDKNRAKR